MKFNRPALLAFSAALFAAATLAIAALWQILETDRAIEAKKALHKTQAEIESSRAQLDEATKRLDESVDTAEQETKKLNDAVKKSRQYQEAQRKLTNRSVGLVNALAAASMLKPAMTEYYLTEGKW